MFSFITGESHATITTSHIQRRHYQGWVSFGGIKCLGGGRDTGQAPLRNYQFSPNDS